jgi:hypothetical protein
MFRRAFDQNDEAARRDAVIRLVYLPDAFVARLMTPTQLAELADGAARWTEPRWPRDPGDAEAVAWLLEMPREVQELRERGPAIAAKNDNISRLLAVEPGWRRLLRCQTLAIAGWDSIGRVAREPRAHPNGRADAEFPAQRIAIQPEPPGAARRRRCPRG